MIAGAGASFTAGLFSPHSAGPRYLVHDHDAKYGSAFARVASATGIRVLRTPIRAPRANAVCERFVGSVRRECLDHTLVLGERHLHRVLAEYVGYFNRARPHQGIGQRTPLQPATGSPRPTGGQRLHIKEAVVAVPVLAGLHHEYRAAA
jgi:putative transposase